LGQEGTARDFVKALGVVSEKGAGGKKKPRGGVSNVRKKRRDFRKGE